MQERMDSTLNVLMVDGGQHCLTEDVECRCYSAHCSTRYCWSLLLSRYKWRWCKDNAAHCALLSAAINALDKQLGPDMVEVGAGWGCAGVSGVILA
jgi:hypothetical protein